MAATTTSTQLPDVAQRVSPGRRLVSLDAMRGFTMFWLMGGHAFITSLARLMPVPLSAAIVYELDHSPWVGLRYYDLIWPCFMLMVGVSVPFSFLRGRDMRRAWMRAIILFLLGSFRTSLTHNHPYWVELSSALQPIAISYLVACYLAVRSRRVQIAAAVLILLAHGLVLAFVPASGVPAASYEKGRNVVASVDLAVLGRPDAEGWGTVLTTAPTISTTILGLIFGQLLVAGCPHLRFTKVLLITGTACLAAGFALSPIVPIIMKLWTATYALASMGWACLIFAAFYWIIDTRGYKRWAFVLTVIGLNALAAYLGPSIVPVGRMAGIFTSPIAHHMGVYGRVFSTGAVLSINWCILFWMYRRKIFLRP